VERLAAGLADLGWVRTNPWREAIAALFDGPRQRKALDHLVGLEVTGLPNQAALLAGWLRSRLDRQVGLDTNPAKRINPVELLAGGEYRDRVDWPRWHVFFGDERRVPLDDERSNYRSARDALLDHVLVPESQVHPLTDADIYEGLLRAFFGEAPAFDLLMLGM